MIFVHSIVSGYICLQGTMAFHIGMLAAMIVFVPVPPKEEIEALFPAQEICTTGCAYEFLEDQNWAVWWFYYAIGMHGILALIHLASSLTEENDGNHSGYISI